MTDTFPDICEWYLETTIKQEVCLGLVRHRSRRLSLLCDLLFLREVGCRKLVDIGCGDFNWMRNVEGDFDYLGIDVVPQVIDANNVKYANDRRRFVRMDATRSAISPGEVALCREVLFHLSFRMAYNYCATSRPQDSNTFCLLMINPCGSTPIFIMAIFGGSIC